MAFFERIDGTDPVGSEPVAGAHEDRRAARGLLGIGTLACPLCDAPVALAAGPVSPLDPLDCPFCSHRSVVREFLSLARPARPARVAVRIVGRRRRAAA